jgi:hypothetical protein
MVGSRVCLALSCRSWLRRRIYNIPGGEKKDGGYYKKCLRLYLKIKKKRQFAFVGPYIHTYIHTYREREREVGLTMLI